MIGKIRHRSFRAICLVLRFISKKLYLKSQCAAKIYRWSDLKIYKLGRIYIIPGVAYRAMTHILNSVNSWNTIDVKTVRNRTVEKLVDVLIHHIPDEYRYHGHSYMAPSVIGQDGGKQ